MNRRDFLAASAATVALTSATAATTAAARPAKGLKVLIPHDPAGRARGTGVGSPGVELVQCRSEDEAIAHAAGATPATASSPGG